MNTTIVDPGLFNNVERYESLMQVVRNRMTNRAFAPYDVPREHFEMIIEASRHAPSGANAQPWHYVVVTDPAGEGSDRAILHGRAAASRQAAHGISDAELQRRENGAGADRRRGRFPVHPGVSGAERRLGAGPEDRQNAERILLQSVPRPRCRPPWRQPRWDTPCGGSRRSGRRRSSRGSSRCWASPRSLA